MNLCEFRDLERRQNAKVKEMAGLRERVKRPSVRHSGPNRGRLTVIKWNPIRAFGAT
jgi:hypothetical protein